MGYRCFSGIACIESMGSFRLTANFPATDPPDDDPFQELADNWRLAGEHLADGRQLPAFP